MEWPRAALIGIIKPKLNCLLTRDDARLGQREREREREKLNKCLDVCAVSLRSVVRVV